jgi:TIGR00093: pseudouridine synthase
MRLQRFFGTRGRGEPPRLRGPDDRWPRDRQRPGRDRAGHQSRCRPRSYWGRRHARQAQPGRRVPDALQADRLPHHHERPAGAPLRGWSGPARPLSGTFPGGSPGPRHHGPFTLYHRRRPVAGPAAPQQACL